MRNNKYLPRVLLSLLIALFKHNSTNNLPRELYAIVLVTLNKLNIKQQTRVWRMWRPTVVTDCYYAA